MLVILEPLLEEILVFARSEAPKEVCGWLAGEGSRVERLYPVPNVAESGFRMHPETQLSAMREIREAGLDIVGTYHSHSHTPAKPSARDIQLGLYPDCLHLIVSLAASEPAVRAFQISRDSPPAAWKSL